MSCPACRPPKARTENILDPCQFFDSDGNLHTHVAEPEVEASCGTCGKPWLVETVHVCWCGWPFYEEEVKP